jgi:hypothetical protein
MDPILPGATMSEEVWLVWLLALFTLALEQGILL